MFFAHGAPRLSQRAPPAHASRSRSRAIWPRLGLGRLRSRCRAGVRWRGVLPGQACAPDAVLVFAVPKVQDGSNLLCHVPPVALLQGRQQLPHGPGLPSLALGPGEEHMADLPVQVVPGRGGGGDQESSRLRPSSPRSWPLPSPEGVADALQLLVGEAQVQGHVGPVRPQASCHTQQVALGQEAGLRVTQVQRGQGESSALLCPCGCPQPLREERRVGNPTSLPCPQAPSTPGLCPHRQFEGQGSHPQVVCTLPPPGGLGLRGDLGGHRAPVEGHLGEGTLSALGSPGAGARAQAHTCPRTS